MIGPLMTLGLGGGHKHLHRGREDIIERDIVITWDGRLLGLLILDSKTKFVKINTSFILMNIN